MKPLVYCILAFTSLHCSAGNGTTLISVSHEDSVRAQAYFNNSWNYSLGSAKHQLYLDSALAIIPTYAFWWQQKSMPLYKEKKYELGRPFIDSAVKYNPEKYLDYRAFIKCIFEKAYTEAIIDFRMARLLHVQSGVMDHSYDFYTGLCFLQLNQLDSCEIYLSRSIEAKSKKLGESWVHATEWFYMGILILEKEDYTNADNYFIKALTAYPHFCDAEYYHALCLERMNKKEKAIEVMQSAWEDYNQGLSFSEDNIIYEAYPYQASRAMIQSSLNWLKKK